MVEQKKEFAIGEVVEYNGVKLEVNLPNYEDCCYGCFFYKKLMCYHFENNLKCCSIERTDKTDVIFVKVEE